MLCLDLYHVRVVFGKWLQEGGLAAADVAFDNNRVRFFGRRNCVCVARHFQSPDMETFGPQSRCMFKVRN